VSEISVGICMRCTYSLLSKHLLVYDSDGAFSSKNISLVHLHPT
jgi:hypothetical protein